MRSIDLELKEALGRGDVDDVARLLAAGADVRYRGEHGYHALVDAVHGRDVPRDPRLLDLLRLLVTQGAELDLVTDYKESGLRVLSHIGRFDGVRLLLEAGADKGQLGWTPLLEAVALGSLADVAREVAAGAPLEAVDWWERTAFLLALVAGDLPKARLLRERGANVDARGRGDTTSLCYAVEGHHLELVRWLVEIGQDVRHVNRHGTSALLCAVDVQAPGCVSVLVEAGADVDLETPLGSVLGHAETKEIAQLLLVAGADPRHLSGAGHRALCGLKDGPKTLASVSAEEFARARTRRFGTANPERIREPFWDAMIRDGSSGYEGAIAFDPKSPHAVSPVWSAMRFGQSITFLPDGRIVQIAGEHEDAYDADFCIYNDVFVHDTDGSIAVYGYPEDVFPPTDFHTATLVDNAIYLIGSLGCHGTRVYGHTPVYRLDAVTLRIERLDTTGEAPGWIYGHRAVLQSPTQVRISGGRIVTLDSERESHTENPGTFVLDLTRLAWHRET